MISFHYLRFLLILLCLVSCQRREVPEHVKYADQVMNDFVKLAYKKYGLVIHGSGGGFLKKINEIDMSFYIKKELTIPEMRLLLIKLSSDFLEKINSGEKSKEYLAEYPFGVDRLNFSITIYDRNYKRIVNPGSSKEKITFAFTNKNKIKYYIINEEKDHLQKVHEETYEDALQIMNKEKVK